MNTVISLNIGQPKQELFYGKGITTGIAKVPVSGVVFLTKTGFEGDGVSDTKHHGGTDKAVCVYSRNHYAHWERVLGLTLPPAAFGENLTVSGFVEGDVCIGDIYQIGSATVEVTQPRQPCNTLATRYGRPDLVKLVVDAGYTGFYLRVLQEGHVEAGVELTLKERPFSEVTITYANNVLHHDRKNREAIQKVLSVPAVSEAWQRSFKELLEKT
ncbi:MAG: MOSC domain-containing protein [Candidatus Magnetobacterium sp. LHC-1]|uniref:MOSC domain-containing protein n=1 Tax=Candidatus Magnetobacterium casense TaxID=1455061 RepID=A0ABS6S3D0_9BACT|nr:MOSC domain-containing protein [Candidatus Magnetobacterium casensis]MBF0608304.1 MOSC domain-containing protein [Nitrospirota bacterium]MBV6343369.1 MOSC domain-containing protein [Candidatus Magnetobacterium casensis]